MLKYIGTKEQLKEEGFYFNGICWEKDLDIESEYISELSAKIVVFPKEDNEVKLYINSDLRIYGEDIKDEEEIIELDTLIFIEPLFELMKKGLIEYGS